jgi:hypothetical protein
MLRSTPCPPPSRNSEKVGKDEENNVIWRNLILPIPTDPALRVDVGAIKHCVFPTKPLRDTPFIVRTLVDSFCQVGRIECPLLLVNGDDDQNWATTESAEDVSTHTLALTHTRRHRHTYALSVNYQVASFDYHYISLIVCSIFVKPFLLTFSGLRTFFFLQDCRC